MTTTLTPESHPSLFDVAGKRTIHEQFVTFHCENPHVYDLLRQFAREAQRSGATRFGIGAIYERARWQWVVAWGKDEAGFRLNNNFRSRYARLLMAIEPDLANFFETRVLRSA